MNQPEYRLIEGHSLPHEAGPVVAIEESEFEGEHYGPGCMFWCPCMERRIVVRTPPHKSIDYDAEGRPTIRASLGAHPEEKHWPEQNWCHSHMTAGRFEFCNDAICPGASGKRLVRRRFLSDGQPVTAFFVYCPACERAHRLLVECAAYPEEVWQFDGNHAAPTFSPSLLVESGPMRPGDPDHICHSYLKAGVWEFLSDSTHAMAGQHVQMVPFPSNHKV